MFSNPFNLYSNPFNIFLLYLTYIQYCIQHIIYDWSCVKYISSFIIQKSIINSNIVNIQSENMNNTKHTVQDQKQSEQKQTNKQTTQNTKLLNPSIYLNYLVRSSKSNGGHKIKQQQVVHNNKKQNRARQLSNQSIIWQVERQLDKKNINTQIELQTRKKYTEKQTQQTNKQTKQPQSQLYTINQNKQEKNPIIKTLPQQIIQAQHLSNQKSIYSTVSSPSFPFPIPKSEQHMTQITNLIKEIQITQQFLKKQFNKGLLIQNQKQKIVKIFSQYSQILHKKTMQQKQISDKLRSFSTLYKGISMKKKQGLFEELMERFNKQEKERKQYEEKATKNKLWIENLQKDFENNVKRVQKLQKQLRKKRQTLGQFLLKNEESNQQINNI